MSTRKPQVLYTPSYWADFHRRRREREARAARTPTAVPSAIGCHDHGLVYTFTPTRAAPFIAVVQNDGRLLNINDRLPAAVLPMPPPPPKPKAPKPSAAALRAKALLDARPTKDEELLARFAVSRARDAAAEGSSKRKAVSRARNDAAEGSSKRKAASDPPAAKDGKRCVSPHKTVLPADDHPFPVSNCSSLRSLSIHKTSTYTPLRVDGIKYT
jgi:hypothetical protein